MKRKICLGMLVLSGCSILVFAGKPDSCADKYKACVDHCANLLSQCKARGSDPGDCTAKFNNCKITCENDKRTCEGNTGDTKKTAPKKTATTKTDAQKK